MVGKVELISTFTTGVCENWNVSDGALAHNLTQHIRKLEF